MTELLLSMLLCSLTVREDNEKLILMQVGMTAGGDVVAVLTAQGNNTFMFRVYNCCQDKEIRLFDYDHCHIRSVLIIKLS